MTRNQSFALIGLLAAAAIIALLVVQMRDGDRATAATAPTQSPPVTAIPASAAPAGSAATKPRVRRLADSKGRAELLRQIREVTAKRSASAGASSSGTAPAPPTLPGDPALDKEFIQASVRELIPLLVECYESGLARDATLAGSVIVNFTIEGEPEVGGVIGESAIDPEASTLKDPAVRECIQETMFAIEIEPPAGGGVVKVRYPFEFRAGEE